MLKEVMDAILISGAISESLILSVAFRKFKQYEENCTGDSLKRRAGDRELMSSTRIEGRMPPFAIFGNSLDYSAMDNLSAVNGL